MILGGIKFSEWRQCFVSENLVNIFGVFEKLGHHIWRSEKCPDMITLVIKVNEFPLLESVPPASVELIDGCWVRIIPIDQDFFFVDNHAPFSTMIAQCVVNVLANKLGLVFDLPESFPRKLGIPCIENFI